MSPVRFLEKTTLPAPIRATLIMACSKPPRPPSHALSPHPRRGPVERRKPPPGSPQAPVSLDVGRAGGAGGVVLEQIAGAIDVFVDRVARQGPADLPADRAVEEGNV